MKRLLSILFLFITQLCWSQSFNGVVIQNNNSSKPIPFAKLHFVDLGATIYADSVGCWEISDAPNGINHVIISAVGFQTVHADISLKQDSIIKINLSAVHHALDKVIVSNLGLLHRESITSIDSRSMADLNEIPNSSLGQSISNINGVYQSGSGIGISKPVIRGLSGSRVVTYVNGLRIQNQQWAADHGLPITDLGIGSVEVIKGPASLLYGSDAIGGVLYFVDAPYADRNSYQVFVRTQFETATLGTLNKLGFKYSKKAVRLSAYGAYNNHADVHLPDGFNLINSRFSDLSGKISFGYNKKRWVLNARYNFYQGVIGIIGDTEDSLITAASFKSTLQERNRDVPVQVVANHFTSVENKFFLGNHELNFLIGNTNNALREFESALDSPELFMNLNNSLYNFRWKVRLWDKVDLITGSQGMFQINKNNPAAEEMLIPDAQTLDLGGYFLAHARIKRWLMQLGGRLDQRQIKTTSPFGSVSNFNESYMGFNLSSGFAHLGQKSTIRFNVSTGFRAPTTSELISDGIHHGSLRYEKGNLNLTTEKAIQLDLSYALHFEHFEFVINPFYNRMTDYIYLAPSDTLQDGYKVFNYTQVSFAQIYGGEAAFHFHPHKAHWLHIESSFSTIFAEDNSKSPLALIPQSRLNTQFKIEFEMNSTFKIQNIVLQHLYFLQQNRLSVGESYSSDYHVINLGLNMIWELQHPIQFSIGVKNLLNEEYYDHLSALKNLGIANPAISGYLSIRFDLTGNLKEM